MSLKINNRFNYLNIEAQMSEQPATLSRAKQIGKALRNNHGPLSLTCVCVCPLRHRQSKALNFTILTEKGG